LNTSHGS